jgi:microcystin degradation protein MlrC
VKVFTAELMTEINRASPLPTGFQSFADLGLYHGTATEDPKFGENEPLSVWRRLAHAQDDQLIEGLCAFAEPAGIVVKSAYERLRDELLNDLRKAGAVDLVLLFLHGAMVAEEYPDCEADILTRAREIAGPKATICLLLDLHANLSPAMTSTADLIIACKEYPHTDFDERAAELFTLGKAIRRRKCRPTTAVVDCRMIGLWHTATPEVHAIVNRIVALEQTGDILTGSLIHGFPWSDVPDVAAKVLIVTDNDELRALQIAESLAQAFWDARERATHRPSLLTETVALATSHEEGPIVIAEVADNPGGGASGDATHLLSALWLAGIDDLALTSLWDPVAVQLCQLAGVNATLTLRMGGKCGPASGNPFDLEVRVSRIVEDYWTTCWGNPMPMGTIVLVASVARPGVQILLNTIRAQTYGPDPLEAVGINPGTKRITVVKSAHHFYARFAPIARHIVYCGTSGTLDMDFANLKLRNGGARCWPITSRDRFKE